LVRKRKAATKAKDKAKEPTITVKAMPLPVAPPIVEVEIRCIYDSKLIVSNTPTGTRYEFETDQIKPVNQDDYQYLLEMVTRPFGCCGGSVRTQKFFEAV
jgi:hypothetical protein